MKYTGVTKKSDGASVYSFSIGKEELELLCGVVSNAFMWMPKTIETMTTRGRLRNIDKILGRVLIEEIGKKTLPTKKTVSFHKKIAVYLGLLKKK